MEGWFPRTSGERKRQRIAMQWDRTQTESPDQATRNGSAAARAEPRAPRLNSRPSSQNGSRRPDRRICGEWGITSCAPTLWKGFQAAFLLDVRVGGAILRPWGARRAYPDGTDTNAVLGAACSIIPLPMMSPVRITLLGLALMALLACGANGIAPDKRFEHATPAQRAGVCFLGPFSR
jgi:hypothetical protein